MARDTFSKSPRIDRMSWDDLRLFALVAQERSIRRAAARAGVGAATLFRRIGELEQQLGARLLNRLPEGVSPTLFGQRALALIDQMAAPVYGLDQLAAEVRGDRAFVSITVTQGLGVNWLVPNAAAFHKANPTIGLDFRIANGVADILRFDSDIGIQMTPPSVPELVAGKLGRMHFELFASQAYLDLYGCPADLAELRRHRFVEQLDGHVEEGHVANVLGELRNEQVAARVLGSCGAIRAIEAGIGIGALPNYSVAFGNKVVPLNLPVTKYRDIWLTYRSDARERAAVTTTITWLKALFDPRRWKCFKDELVPAKDVGPMPLGISG
ncbi:LysR family transcriptional regulator [Bosea massiliensis]|uniref:LysR family transcriptional regulator n=1 Tax=Bosea massiliensis TaxID=151419 RepID=A0ABW0P6Q9_9HYPH